MKSICWKRAREIAELALDTEEPERTRVIHRSCDGDDELLAAVKILVGDENDDSGFLTPPDLPTLRRRLGPEWFPERIGAYRITGVLGQGGMGTVFEAEQELPHRSVALKMMDPGRASATAIRRFRVETEVLARLRHPGIAQIYEVGALDEDTSTPSLYFAMELIEDATELTRYATDRELSRPDRIRLFLRVCGAVQHGHDRGVIHRDLKPGNILVSGAGDPKLIDYGVARIGNLEPSLRTTDEERAHLVGTLRYMSPEQLAGSTNDVDIRTDLYALGVCLYELLLGRTPHRFKSDSLGEALQALLHEKPTNPRSLQPGFPMELEWILLKTLSPNPAQRYPSVLALASDLERFLRFEPVEAGPESHWYRLRKTIRRHRIAVGSGALVLLSLVTLLVVITLNLFRERELVRSANLEKERALKEERRVQFVSAFLLDMFSRVNPGNENGVEVLMVDVLDEATEAVASELTEDVDLEYKVREAIGLAYSKIHHFQRAEPHLLRCLELLPQLESRPPESPRDLHLILAINLRLQGNFQAARDHAERALTLSTPESIEEIEAESQLAFIKLDSGQIEEAESDLEKIVAWHQRHTDATSPALATALKNMASLKLSLGKLEDCEEMARFALDVARREFGSDDWRITSSLNTLASALNRKGDHELARPLYEEALRIRRQKLGRNHFLSLVTQNNLASLLMEESNESRDLARAESILLDLAECLENREFVDPGLLAGLNNLGWLFLEQDRISEAIDVLENLVALSEKAPGPYWRQGFFRRAYGVALFRNDEVDSAEEQFLRGYEILTSTVGPDHLQTKRMASSLEQLYRQTGQLVESREWAKKQ